jgi:hypothetical protein
MTKEKVEEIRARYNAIESMDPAATIDYIEFAKQAHRDRLDLLRYIDSLHAEPRATRGYLGSTPDGGIDDADHVLEDAIPLMPDDVANKITDLVLSDGIAYVLYKADELPVVLRRQDITENRQEHAMQALADQAQALDMGYGEPIATRAVCVGGRAADMGQIMLLQVPPEFGFRVGDGYEVKPLNRTGDV